MCYRLIIVAALVLSACSEDRITRAEAIQQLAAGACDKFVVCSGKEDERERCIHDVTETLETLDVSTSQADVDQCILNMQARDCSDESWPVPCTNPNGF